MLGFSAVPAWSQTDTTTSGGQFEYSCAFTTPTTLACVKGDVDANDDGMLDSDEWAQVPEEDRSIIDLENQFGDEGGATREEPVEIGVPEDPNEDMGTEDGVLEDDEDFQFGDQTEGMDQEEGMEEPEMNPETGESQNQNQKQNKSEKQEHHQGDHNY